MVGMQYHNNHWIRTSKLYYFLLYRREKAIASAS